MRNPKTQRRATRLRRDATDCERLLWRRLRRRQLSDLKFRRQVPIGPYIADFACLEAALIVELNGGQHLDRASDRTRDAFLERQGFRILRFWNHEIVEQLDAVVETVAAEAGCARSPRVQSFR